jgi:hypothetical protein
VLHRPVEPAGVFGNYGFLDSTGPQTNSLWIQAFGGTFRIIPTLSMRARSGL